MSVRAVAESPSVAALADRALQLHSCLVLALDGVLEDGDANLATYAPIGLWRVAHDVMDLLEEINAKLGNRAARPRLNSAGRSSQRPLSASDRACRGRS